MDNEILIDSKDKVLSITEFNDSFLVTIYQRMNDSLIADEFIYVEISEVQKVIDDLIK